MAVADRRERERQARRQAILDAAERVMSRSGLWATTMEEVAAEAEFSKGTLYLYFDNKDALCAAIADRSLSGLSPKLEEVMRPEPTALGKLSRSMELYARFLRDRPHLFRMMLSWMLMGVQDGEGSALSDYRQAVGQLVGRVVEVISEGQREGTIRTDHEPLTLAVQLWASLLGVMLLELNPDDVTRRLPFPIDTDALVPTYMANMIRALHGPSASEDA